MLKENDANLRARLARLIAAAPGVADAGAFNGAKIMLFKNDVTPGRSTVLADLTPPTYTGYALSGAVAWGTPFSNESGAAEILGDGKQFPCTADSTAETIYGYGCVNAAGTALLFAERFTNPVSINTAGDNVFILPRYTLGRG